jgi:integrase
LADLTQGPVYRKIDRWGRVGQQGLNADSLIPLLRSLFRDVGLEGSEEYSSHSMRRGFATWARDSGWDLKSLMAYVGWKDVKSAMRYLDVSDASVRAKFESSLASLPALAKDS